MGGKRANKKKNSLSSVIISQESVFVLPFVAAGENRATLFDTTKTVDGKNLNRITIPTDKYWVVKNTNEVCV